jgi:hypothetical protein
VPIFIGRGAPFAYKTTNISVLDLFARNGGLEDILAAEDPDGLVVDLDRLDDRMDVVLPGVNGARPSADGALVSAGAQMGWSNGFSLAGTFEGEFSDTTHSYAGKGTVRYTW